MMFKIIKDIFLVTLILLVIFSNFMYFWTDNTIEMLSFTDKFIFPDTITLIEGVVFHLEESTSNLEIYCS